MDKIDKLKDIWDNIPKAVNEQLDLSQKEIINQYMDVFHFGAYFYVIFNTRTAEMEYVSPNVEQVLGYYNIHRNDDFLLSLNMFSEKEREILKFVVQGLTSENIAQKLGKSIHTVRNQRKHILEKSGCENVQELLVKAVREGWV